jgi:hypothetical protein
MNESQGRSTSIRHFAGTQLDDDSWRATLLLVLGLDGNPEVDWADENGPFQWIMDLCASNPGLSVQTLGFSASKNLAQASDTLDEIAHVALSEIRSMNLLGRYLVVCSYSYGGLVFKRMMCDLDTHPERIYFNQKIINLRLSIFLGVPHKGSYFAEKIRHVPKRRPHSLDELIFGSRVLKDLSRRFDVKFHSLNFEILSIRETKGLSLSDVIKSFLKLPFSIGNATFRPVVEPHLAEAGINGEFIFDVEANHRELLGFAYDGSTEPLQKINAMMGDLINPNVESSSIAEFISKTGRDRPARN